jgi:hypothetical protein
MTAPLTPEQERAASLAEALDLEPITFKLMHPHPGQAVMTLADADQLIAYYRGFLKLCLWYPAESIVPSKEIDEAWHAHILDTAKYAADCDALFGRMAHHFPYFGLRGPDDEAAWRAAYDRTRDLFRWHFGIAIEGDAAAACEDDGPEGNDCEHRGVAGAAERQRPRPARAAA